MDKKFIVLFILVLAIGIIVRSLTIQYHTFIEPDIFIYYSIAQQTIANHLTITSVLSGFPNHIPYNESPFLVYVPILLSYLVGSLQNAIFILPIIAAVIEMLLIYLTAKEITDNKWAGLIAMFLFAIIVAAILKNSIGEWRGETIVPALQLLGTWIAIKGFKQKKKLYLMLAAIVWILSLFTWNGAPYIAAVIGIALIFYCIDMFEKSIYKTVMIGALISGIAVVIYYFASPYFGAANLVGSTILETQAPTFEFILGAYGLILPLALIGIGILIWEVNQTKEVWKKQAVYLMLGLLITTLALQAFQIRWEALAAIPVALLGGIGLESIYYALMEDSKKSKNLVYFITFMIVIAMVITLLKQVPFYAPADDINQQFLQAMSWMKNNTNSNATVLTFWPDGSVVEGAANRQSFTDSIMSSNEINIENFAKYLHATAGNESYINQVKPDYIVARNVWQYEAQAIGQEGGYGSNCTYILNTTLEAKEYNGSQVTPQGYTSTIYHQQTINQSQCNFNQTNMQQLINGSAPYEIVFRNNDTLIYKVS